MDRSGIPDFLAADCGVVCFERTTQVNVRIVGEESLVYRPVSHVVLGYLNGMPWAGTTLCAGAKFMENLSLSLVAIRYPNGAQSVRCSKNIWAVPKSQIGVKTLVPPSWTARGLVCMNWPDLTSVNTCLHRHS